MKEFVFLFPIKEYIDNTSLVSYYCDCTQGTNNGPERINELIEARYRKQGFCINWLMFKGKGRKRTYKGGFDPKTLSSYIKTIPQDRFLVSNRTYEEMGLGKYTSTPFVLKQIPQPIEQLVVAGFHLNDCVDKFAESAYKQGIPTFVDSDLTELFFHSAHNPIPLIWDCQNLEDIGSQTMRELITFRRKFRPWLMPPPQTFVYNF